MKEKKRAKYYNNNNHRREKYEGWKSYQYKPSLAYGITFVVFFWMLMLLIFCYCRSICKITAVRNRNRSTWELAHKRDNHPAPYPPISTSHTTTTEKIENHIFWLYPELTTKLINKGKATAFRSVHIVIVRCTQTLYIAWHLVRLSEWPSFHYINATATSTLST